MAKRPGFESPVAKQYSYVDPQSLDPPDALVLTDTSETTKWLVRAASDGSVAEHLGVSFGASRCTGGALILGSRPGEWIVFGTPDGVSQVVTSLEQFANTSFLTTLDWSHGRALFRVAGSTAPVMLEKVCSVDFSDSMTPDGAVGSASVAKVTCDFARDDDGDIPSYWIFCDRSFGQFLFDALIDAGAEFDLLVAPPTA